MGDAVRIASSPVCLSAHSDSGCTVRQPPMPRPETTSGKPVVTGTQATLLAASRRAGVDDAVPGAGRIFASH